MMRVGALPGGARCSRRDLQLPIPVSGYTLVGGGERQRPRQWPVVSGSWSAGERASPPGPLSNIWRGGVGFGAPMVSRPRGGPWIPVFAGKTIGAAGLGLAALSLPVGRGWLGERPGAEGGSTAAGDLGAGLGIGASGGVAGTIDVSDQQRKSPVATGQAIGARHSETARQTSPCLLEERLCA